jgi:hypothetical protein
VALGTQGPTVTHAEEEAPDEMHLSSYYYKGDKKSFVFIEN